MNIALLEKAVEALQINDVFLFSSNNWINKQFLPAYNSSTYDLETQFKHIITNSELISFEDDSKNSTSIIRFYAEFGARMIDVQLDEDNNQKALIEATYVAEYALNNIDLDQDAITEFALNNVMFNVWPYWREYLTSTCDRMGLPKIVVPFMKRAQNCPS